LIGALESGELGRTAASFAPIPLEVLNRQAELATRSERKYILDEAALGPLVAALTPHYTILEIGGERVFPYDTVYFDTPAWTTYRHHVQDRRRRFKCRTRLYPATGSCFFEVKLKGGRGETIKRRLAVDPEEHGFLTSRALDFLEQELSISYRTSAPAALAPALRTYYRRLTLAGRAAAERLTLDFELAFACHSEKHAIRPGRILLECKTAAGLGEADRVLQRLGVRPITSCSKFCLGVALTHPELRDNPFRPLIRRHFDARPQAKAPSEGLVPAPLLQEVIDRSRRRARVARRIRYAFGMVSLQR
jgi:hypothetical protein